jgi:hypothetical protein
VHVVAKVAIGCYLSTCPRTFRPIGRHNVGDARKVGAHLIGGTEAFIIPFPSGALSTRNPSAADLPERLFSTRCEILSVDYIRVVMREHHLIIGIADGVVPSSNGRFELV